jgi:hypothetical protein
MTASLQMQIQNLLSTFKNTATSYVGQVTASPSGPGGSFIGPGGVPQATNLPGGAVVQTIQGTQYSLSAEAIARGGIPGFAEGTPYVPRTGLAIVHQGERITPAGELPEGMAVMHLHFEGSTFYGMNDFAQKVNQIVRDTMLGGGYRGLIARPSA